MNKYELNFAISPSVSDEEREGIINKVNEILISNGATDVNIEKTGLRKFAYTIKFKNEGFYVLVNFNADSSVPAKLTNFFKINENVLRFICIAK